MHRVSFSGDPPVGMLDGRTGRGEKLTHRAPVLRTEKPCGNSSVPDRHGGCSRCPRIHHALARATHWRGTTSGKAVPC